MRRPLFLSPKKAAKVHAATLQVLEETGVQLDHTEAESLYLEAGATKDKEGRILDAVYGVLIDIVKDTTTDPRLKHPLSDDTRRNIRDCLDLITARRAELSEANGAAGAKMRPRYVDEPQSSVVVSLNPGKKKPEK